MPQHLLVENFLPADFVDRIEKTFNDPNLPWFYNHSTVGFSDFMENDYGNKNIADTFQFNHTVWHDDRYLSTKYVSDMCLEILLHLQNNIQKEICKIGRIKANLTLKTNWHSSLFHPPHYDATEPDAMSFVYFVNDSDGDLRVFNKMLDTRFQCREDVLKSYEDLICIKSISPKKGTGCLFPSQLLHAGSCPINLDKRIVINFIIGLESN